MIMAERSKVISEKQAKKPRPASFNVAKAKDMYTSLPAPKPRRTHSAGLSGIVELITEHLKSSPPPSLRQSSPHPSKHIANPYITHESNRCSSASITEEQLHDTFNPTGVNLGSSMFQPAHAPVAMLAEFCATPFLGDRKSESGDLNLLFASSVGIRRGGQRIGEHKFTKQTGGFRRSFSLEGLSGKAALTPCMISMPAGRPYYDLSDALESIPPHSWILPYVIACTPPEILGQLLTLPFLVEGQSHTHTTATAITRSRAHTISYDIDPVDSENAFTVPLNIKNVKNVAEAAGATDNTSTINDVGTEQDTPFVNTEDWYSYDASATFEIPLGESSPRRGEHMSSTSPLDDLPVTRARGHTHTGSVYELPDPSLFNIPAKVPLRARDSLGRKKDGDFDSLIRMSSTSPRFGGSNSGQNIEQIERERTVVATTSIMQLQTTVAPAISTATSSASHPPLLAPAPIKPKTNPFSLANPLPNPPNPRTPSPATLGIVPQSMNFPSSWRSLGILWLCSDPKWNQWHPKIVFLLDNYLLECTAIGMAVIGFSQLSGAVIEKKMFQYNARLPAETANRKQTARTATSPVYAKDVHNSTGNTQHPSSEDDYFHEILTEEVELTTDDEFSPRYAASESFSPRSPNIPTTTTNHNANHSNNHNNSHYTTSGHTFHTAHGASQLASYGLKITCFTTSNAIGNFGNNSKHSMGFDKNTMEPNTHSFWLTTHDEASLDLIAIALQRASTLTFEDVFEVQNLTVEDSLLGQGRFNEVRLARRREDLDLLSSSLFSAANTTTNTTANPSVAPSVVPSRVHSVVPSMVPSVVTSAHASYLASPQGKSRSTSNAPEYIPYTNTISGNGNSSSVNDASAMVVKHGVLHFNQHVKEDVSDVCDPDPWKVNHAISSSYSKTHSIPPATTTTHHTTQSQPLTTSTAHSQKVSSEISAEASFRSVSSANSSDNYEDFSPVHSAMNKELLMQAYGASQQHTRTDQIYPSMDGINMTSSVSSQGPLFEMLQSPQVSPFSAKQSTSIAAEGPADPFAVNVNISCSSHSRRRLDSRDQAPPPGMPIDPFAIQSGAVSKVGAVAVDDRMSDDILPSGHAVGQTHTTHMSSTTVHNNPFSSESAVSVAPRTEIGPDQMSMQHSDDPRTADVDHDHDNNNSPDARFQGQELHNCCAMKLVAKEIFWRRVDEGCERGDALVREVLAQMLVAAHFADHPALALSSVLNVQPYLNAADSVALRSNVNKSGVKCDDNRGTEGVTTSVEGIALSASVLCTDNSNGISATSEATTLLHTEQQGHLPLVQLFSAFETADGFAMELELMQSMDLFDLLAEVGTVPEYHVQSIVAQLIEAVSLCHKLGIAHRDIKLSNVCFSMNQVRGRSVQSLLQSKECIRVKLADFGMAGFLARDKKLRGRCGTPGYVAPDILKADKNGSYGLNVDMFSIGVVAYTLLCGYEPFYGCDNQDLLKANKAADYKFHRPDWDVISSDAKDFIAKALLSSADERLTPEGARKHSWLKGLAKSNSAGNTTCAMRRSSTINAHPGAHSGDDGDTGGNEGAESGRLKSCVIS